MLLRKVIIAAGLLEYERHGADEAELKLMGRLFDFHLTEAYKHCVLGTDLQEAHEHVCIACRKLPSPEPDPFTKYET